MQLFPIVLVAAILMYDRVDGDGGLTEVFGAPVSSDSAWMALLWTLVPYAALVVVGWVLIVRLHRRALARSSMKTMLTTYRVASLVRLGAIVHHVQAVYVLGSLDAVRRLTGDLIFVDEVIVLVFPILVIMSSWAMVYPVEKYLRDVTMIRRLDQGRALYPLPGRMEYVFLQLRTQVFPLFVPLLAILAGSETVRTIARSMDDASIAVVIDQWGTFGVTLLVFIVSPLMVRAVLSVEPLGKGPLRTRMQDVCSRNRVGVRELLLWRTGGAMINAAVMGLISPIRYVMMTDALIETMSERQLTAVMAHEVGHVRKHHMVWLLLSIFAILLLTSFAIDLPLYLMSRQDPDFGIGQPWIDYVSLGIAIAATLFLFGWVSRRFERQADVFAVRHLSQHPIPTVEQSFIGPVESHRVNVQSSDIVTQDAVNTMQSALGTISRLNMVSPTRRSWRHGSIAWRQAYLNEMIGVDVQSLPIDRTVRRIHWATVLVIILGLGASWLLRDPPREPEPELFDRMNMVMGGTKHLS